LPLPASYRNRSSGSQRKSGTPLIVLISQGCSGLKRVRIPGLPSGPKLFCRVAFVTGGGDSFEKPRACYAPRRLSADFLERGGAAEFTPQYLSTALVLKDRGRATPPHRQNYLSVALLGNGQLVQTRDYTYAPRLCQARSEPSRFPVKKMLRRHPFLLKSVPKGYKAVNPGKA